MPNIPPTKVHLGLNWLNAVPFCIFRTLLTYPTYTNLRVRNANFNSSPPYCTVWWLYPFNITSWSYFQLPKSLWMHIMTERISERHSKTIFWLVEWLGGRYLKRNPLPVQQTTIKLIIVCCCCYCCCCCCCCCWCCFCCCCCYCCCCCCCS